MSAPYQLFKPLAPTIEAALRASIDRFGVLVPVVKDQHGNILDGHQRARLADEIGVKYPVNIVEVADEEEALEIARTLNEDRRAMPKQERLPVVQALREEGHSLRAIAGAVGVDQRTVQRDLSTAAPAAVPDRVKSLDGKSRPSRKEPKLPSQDVLAQAREIDSGYQLTAPKETKPWQPIYLSESNEWYTPAEYIQSAREVMGGIEIDPASNARANEIIRAQRYFTADDSGIEHEWPGRVWLNPPWGRMQGAFVSHLIMQFEAQITTQAIVLVNAHSTETDWFAPLWDHILCFTDHRIDFYGGNGLGSTHGSVFVYLGPNREGFIREFDRWGYVVERVKP